MTNNSIDFVDVLGAVQYDDIPATNLEMETAGIYGLAKALGHEAISFNALLANRVSGKFSKHPQKAVDRLVELVLSRITKA